MIDKTFPIDESPRVEVQTHTGTVRFKDGEPEQIRVVIEARSEGEVEVEQRGGGVVVRSPSRPFLNRDRTAITLYVPEKTVASVSTTSADVRAMTPLSELEVNTASGDVEFSTVDQLAVRTASGDVRGEQVTDMAWVVSASGDVRIDSCQGKAVFSSASGDIELRQCAGGMMKASTASGDVSVELCQSSEVKCKSMSGSVNLGFQRGTHLELDVDTLSGRVRLPDRPAKKVETVRNVVVKARLVSGDVNLFVSE